MKFGSSLMNLPGFGCLRSSLWRSRFGCVLGTEKTKIACFDNYICSNRSRRSRTESTSLDDDRDRYLRLLEWCNCNKPAICTFVHDRSVVFNPLALRVPAFLLDRF